MPVVKDTTKSKKQKRDANLDARSDDLDASQVSIGSDETRMASVLAEQMRKSADKKQKLREAKFLQAMKRELAKAMTLRGKEMSAISDELTGQSEKYAMAYAENEDCIRGILSEIMKEREKITELVKRREALHSEESAQMERDSVAGLASVKRRCEGAQRQSPPTPSVAPYMRSRARRDFHVPIQDTTAS
ncbi:hypothetical protein HETIRDRAFT_455375 [Heterobasidion irregulare TC 32-1]|uniref:Uncharacterized protein n=1 Tax=Heterobasidion irregulare (strain TC 32-1) TaxID=747525 RepID=W4JQ42_HETIT|nr:uncharacterized protein HETIRDRAFT_455375 [Heterobasidion irregulare TC 32-1]ETW75653.1 hypothetical protein HETIRDRAFT_455375 [Heterobasidion irregulare TC 32-1]